MISPSLTHLLLATRNPGKAREVREILTPYGLTVATLEDCPKFEDHDVEETGQTFLENALIKAMWAAEIGDRVVLADDSGLEVDGLDGAPGVRSARFSGPAATAQSNNAKLIRVLSRVPEPLRTARFRCVVVLFVPPAVASAWPEPIVDLSGPLEFLSIAEGRAARLEGGIALWYSGALEGRIIDRSRGVGGFGYDPHFYLPDLDRTVAELPAEQKNLLSHRGHAFRKIGKRIASLTGPEPLGSEPVCF